MPTTCGISVNMDSLKGVLSTQVSSFLNLKGSLGTIGGIGALSGVISGGLDGIKASVTAMIPEIPISTSAFSSLRDDLNSVIQSAGGGLTDFLTKYAGLTSLSGFANINLTDLAQSALSLSASFDPCSIDVPNVLADATGKLEKLAASAPSIGETIQAGKNLYDDQTITDMFATAQSEITTLTASMDVDTLKSTIDANIQMAKTFSDGIVQKLPTGEEILLTTEGLVASLQTEALNMIDEETQSYSSATIGQLV